MSNDKKPDFSNVQSSSDTAPAGGGASLGRLDGKPDFSNVVGGSDTVAGSPDAVPSERTYTIEKGDTLSAVAQRFYGKAKYWRQIHEANRDTIDNPDRIFPGQTIKLPAIDIDGDGTPDDPAAA
ncbi:MAG: LysM peptidoglycan-binding domain-containing protein [Luteimonas sp.]|nr:LysM peptidoglycan-binding domain-containing protein [Luteimonas sp.]